MRRFVDAEGNGWDVIVGRESWGSLFALFVPAGGGSRVVRQTLLAATTPEAAERELEALGDAGLVRLFERSTPKES